MTLRTLAPPNFKEVCIPGHHTDNLVTPPQHDLFFLKIVRHTWASAAFTSKIALYKASSIVSPQHSAP